MDTSTKAKLKVAETWLENIKITIWIIKNAVNSEAMKKIIAWIWKWNKEWWLISNKSVLDEAANNIMNMISKSYSEWNKELKQYFKENKDIILKNIKQSIVNRYNQNFYSRSDDIIIDKNIRTIDDLKEISKMPLQDNIFLNFSDKRKAKVIEEKIKNVIDQYDESTFKKKIIDNDSITPKIKARMTLEYLANSDIDVWWS